ncbi:MAG: hypothetical protein LBQ44_09710 [Treponema sp.]|nr:hypothetical protein [Treponema sp.]
MAATAIELEAALVTNDTDLLKLSFPGLEILNIT